VQHGARFLGCDRVGIDQFLISGPLLLELFERGLIDRALGVNVTDVNVHAESLRVSPIASFYHRHIQ
jgi:hypothetical protein